MKQIAACAVVLFLGLATNFLGLATHASAAELVEKQWSALFPDHSDPREIWRAHSRALWRVGHHAAAGSANARLRSGP